MTIFPFVMAYFLVSSFLIFLFPFLVAFGYDPKEAVLLALIWPIVIPMTIARLKKLEDKMENNKWVL